MQVKDQEDLPCGNYKESILNGMKQNVLKVLNIFDICSFKEIDLDMLYIQT